MSRTDHARKPRLDRGEVHTVTLEKRGGWIWTGDRMGWFWTARCNCGCQSEELPTKRAARTWRREHVAPGGAR